MLTLRRSPPAPAGGMGAPARSRSTVLRLTRRSRGDGYVLALALGPGYATEALHAMRDRRAPGRLRLTAVSTRNRASWRVMQKAARSVSRRDLNSTNTKAPSDARRTSRERRSGGRADDDSILPRYTAIRT